MILKHGKDKILVIWINSPKDRTNRRYSNTWDKTYNCWLGWKEQLKQWHTGTY